MRGTQNRRCRKYVISGIIPAYAGNTSPARPVTSSARDHPRICGEHPKEAVPWVPPLGSSPHMRGTRCGRETCRSRPGIIPAYAGNTSRRTWTSCMTRDHPRICGEHLVSALALNGNAGSSPHMRGTQETPNEQRNTTRIIPAYAGNTCIVFWCVLYCRDHPRICGEHIAGLFFICQSPGSSPHMRGTLIFRRRLVTNHRIIPAYAGNTSSKTIF